MQNRFIAAFLAAGTLLAAASAAQAQAPGQQAGQSQCLRLGDVDGFTAIKGYERAFIVTDKMHRRYRIGLVSRCGGLDYNMALGFKTLESGRLGCIRRGDSVISRDPGVAGNRCPIASVDLYTPAMEAVDKAAANAKPR